PTCGVPRCGNKLASTKHPFCPEHYAMTQICRVVGCNEKTRPGSKVCSDPAHHAGEVKYHEAGTAAFQLK
ncbi:hypothetical protein K435DRAFT_562595, partial [Dendrothele bispora CBS 962.96]